MSIAATSIARAGSGRVTAPDHGYDHDDEVRPLPSTEPSPGVRPGRPAAGGPPCPEGAPGVTAATPARSVDPAPGRPGHADADEVPVPARRAAHALMVMALEVVDRKRSPKNMRGAFPDHLVEMLRSLARVGVPGLQLGTARIHRLHIHPAAAGAVDDADSSAASSAGTFTANPAPGSASRAAETVDYEVCATYARGPRLFAIAARIRVSPTGASCTALRLV